MYVCLRHTYIHTCSVCLRHTYIHTQLPETYIHTYIHTYMLGGLKHTYIHTCLGVSDIHTENSPVEAKITFSKDGENVNTERPISIVKLQLLPRIAIRWFWSLQLLARACSQRDEKTPCTRRKMNFGLSANEPATIKNHLVQGEK